MILVVFVLFFLGCIAIVLEVVLPFAISATLGLILIGLSCYMAFQNADFLTGLLYTFMALVTSLLLTRWTVRSSIHWLNLKPAKKSEPAIAARTLEQPKRGDMAKVVQPLRPTGSVEWSGRRLAARSVHPEREVPTGRMVRIEGQDSIFLLVEEAEEPASLTPSKTTD